MAKYNTYLVCLCKSGRSILVTSSARKATRMLEKGRCVEIWNENTRLKVVHQKTREQMAPYIRQEQDYLFAKQVAAERRNNKQTSFLSR